VHLLDNIKNSDPTRCLQTDLETWKALGRNGLYEPLGGGGGGGKGPQAEDNSDYDD
jgi:hypothetical protein